MVCPQFVHFFVFMSCTNPRLGISSDLLVLHTLQGQPCWV